MKTIQLRAVSRTYGRMFALHRVSTSLHAGQITAVLGDNGAGKSTLLNILATLDAPSDGQVLFDTTPWKSFARRGRASIGLVSHDSLVYDELTGRENLTFYARMYGLGDVERRVQRWIERVNLTDAQNRPVATYSRGMRQRLTIARALLHEPELVLFDEPTTGLDQQGIRDVGALLLQLRDEGRIVVVITHDFQVLDGRIDKLLVLRRGKLRYDGTAPTTAAILQAYEQHA